MYALVGHALVGHALPAGLSVSAICGLCLPPSGI